MCRGTQRPRISPALVLRLDIESEVLDHVIGEQLPAHRLDALARLVLARPLDAHLDVLADSHVDDLAKAERGKTLLDRDPLGVVDHRLGSNNHARDHGRRPRREIRSTGGPDARRGRAPERAHASMRKRGADTCWGPRAEGMGAVGRMGAEDPPRGSGRDLLIMVRSSAWAGTAACRRDAGKRPGIASASASPRRRGGGAGPTPFSNPGAPTHRRRTALSKAP